MLLQNVRTVDTCTLYVVHVLYSVHVYLASILELLRAGDNSAENFKKRKIKLVDDDFSILFYRDI